MTVRATTDYSVRIMLYLAQNIRGAASSEIAENTGIPQKYLIKISASLRNAGLIVSRHGFNGGYMLARSSSEITVWDILCAAEPDSFSSSSSPAAAESALLSGNSSLRQLFERIDISRRAVLQSVTLLELINVDSYVADSGRQLLHFETVDNEGSSDSAQRIMSIELGSLASIVISCNLTQNSYVTIRRDDFAFTHMPGRGTFDDLFSDGISSVPEAEHDNYIKAFSREKLLAAHLRGEKRVELEHNQIGDSGAVRRIRTWILFVKTAYDDSDVYGIILARDITGTRTPTDSERLKCLTNSLPGAVAEISLSPDEVRVPYFSRGVASLIGCSPEDLSVLTADAASSFVYEEDLPELSRQLELLRKCEQTVDFSFRIRAADGKDKRIGLRAAVKERDGQNVTVSALLLDITKEKHEENALRVSEEKHKIAASLGNKAVLSYDVGQKTIEVISSSPTMDNFSLNRTDVPESAILSGQIASGSANAVRKIFSEIAQGEPRGRVPLAIYDSLGARHWLETSYATVCDERGAPVAAIITFDDVTASRQANTIFNISSAYMSHSNRASKVIVVDITDNCISYESPGPHGLFRDVVGSTHADASLAHSLESYVQPEDRAACAEFFSPSHFLDSFNNGVFEESFEYRGKSSTDEVRWFNVQTQLEQEPYSGNILLYAVFSDINEQKLTELRRLKHEQTDPLTGLMNRENFVAEAASRFTAAGGDNEVLCSAVVRIDVDRLENLRGDFGHDAGDAALRDTAQHIRASLRDDDIVARLGDGGFVALLQRMPSAEIVEQRCARMCASLSRGREDGFSVSVSVGIAVCPFDGNDFHSLLNGADAAVKQASSAGGDCCARFTSQGETRLLPRDNTPESKVSSKKVFARTFGYFDVFVDGVPVRFTNAKEKELLAVLIDRNGGTLSASEAIAILWEDEPAGERQNTRYRKLAMNLRNTLQEVGVYDLIVTDRGIRNIDKTKLECDYYNFLEGDEDFRRLYHGFYMANYSWAEETVSVLNEMI